MAERIRFSLVLGTREEGDHVVISGQTEAGPIEVELPGNCMAILTANFQQHAVALQSGAKREHLHPTLQVIGYETFAQPEGAAMMLQCLPDLRLWFAIPAADARGIGKGLVKAASAQARKKSTSFRL